MPLRRHAEWMQRVDDRLLEYLESEGTQTPKSIADEWGYDYHRETLGRRLRLLTKAGLVEKVGRGVYRITETGVGYLIGQEDLRDEPEPE